MILDVDVETNGLSNYDDRQKSLLEPAVIGTQVRAEGEAVAKVASEAANHHANTSYRQQF